MPFGPKTMDGGTWSVILSIRLHVNNLGHSFPLNNRGFGLIISYEFFA